MKIVNFLHRSTHRRGFGVINGTGIVDVSAHTGCDDIRLFLAGNRLEEAAVLALRKADLRLEEVSFLPVIDRPNKIFGVGMNYAQKRVEFNETSSAPTLFVRFADSQIGHGQPVIKPAASAQFDYEGELAVVIGRPGRAIRPESALEHIAGYSCYMDGSARDWQHGWYTAGKNWPATGAFGPWLVTRDEIPDPHALSIRTWLNHREVQCDNTANMLRRIPDLIAYISSFTDLSAGDVILTGSPGGVGKARIPPLYLQPGDLIEVEIEGIGRLSNPVCPEQEISAAG